jgi:phosphate transport system substrate-binding protein
MKVSKFTKSALVAVAALSIAIAPSAFAGTTLAAGGATSVTNLVQACKSFYNTDTGDSFPYNSVGSGQGQKDLEGKKIDFAFSDSTHLKSQSGIAIDPSEIHIPAMVWPIGIMTNLNTSKAIALSPKTLGGIFSGKITRWNDPAIVADNNRTVTVTVYKKDKAGKIIKDATGKAVVLRTSSLVQKISMPNQPITVVYRLDSSGTTDNLTAALKALDPTNFTDAGKVFNALASTKAAIAADPIHFQSASGSALVASLAAKTKYSITYDETNYAKSAGLKLVQVINPNGDLVAATDDGAAAFVSTSVVADNGTVTLDYTNKNPGVYPFTVVTYALALTNYGDATKAAAVKKAIEYHAFTCAKKVADSGFITIDPTTPLGKKITSQLAKLGK